MILKEKNQEEKIILNISNEFFLDITFKNIPKEFHPYKLLSLTGLSKEDNI